MLSTLPGVILAGVERLDGAKVNEWYLYCLPTELTVDPPAGRHERTAPPFGPLGCFMVIGRNRSPPGGTRICQAGHYGA